MKQQLIIFEGIDGAGKNTLHDFVRIARNYTDMHIVRSTATQYVYSKVYNRIYQQLSNYDFESAINTFIPKPLYVLVDTSPHVALKRRPEENIMQLFTASDLFRKYFDSNLETKRKLYVSNDNIQDLKNAVKLIVEELQKYD